MTTLRVYLFGKFITESHIGPVGPLHGAKVQELFSYLLLNRNRPHLREVLATMLWSDLPSATAKLYLRKTVWQMQSALAPLGARVAPGLFLVDADWIQLNTRDTLWLDVAQFEYAYQQVEDTYGENLDHARSQLLAEAVQLYRGDLLEGCYQEWCLFERERLERMYLIMLEKLIRYCTVHGKYEAGIAYGVQVLRRDPARERTHRHLMRLQYLAGNRSEALRQYARCVSVLHKELNVPPSSRTVSLYDRILADTVEANENGLVTIATPPNPMLQNTLLHLEGLLQQLAITEQQIRHDIERVEAILAGTSDHS